MTTQQAALKDTADSNADAATDVEVQARNMGWRPKDEYGGDPSRWISAEEFVKKGENELPVLRENLRRMSQQFEETKGLLVDVLEHQRKQTQKAVDEAIAATRAERKEAVKDGDIEKVEELDDKIDKLKEEKSESSKKTTKADIPKEIVEWAARETWFNTDKRLNKFAIDEYEELLKDPDLTDAERLKRVSREVRKRFPEKFVKAKAEGGSDVEGGARNGGGGGGKTYADLPPDAKKICDDLCRTIKGYTKEKYLKLYAW